jgi:hypothetical protein
MINNVGIKVLDQEHGKKVIEWFQSQGVDTSCCSGYCVNWIYGVFNGRFNLHTEANVLKSFPEFNIITLPEELPKDWYIQITEENFDELEAWRKSVCDPKWTSSPQIGYFILSKHKYDNSYYSCHLKERMLKSSYPNHVKIDLETFRKITGSSKQTQKEMKPRIITAEQAQSIIDIACTTWTGKLADKWAKDIVTKKPIEISEEFYQEMRKACTDAQHKLFDQIFGVDDGSVDLSHLITERVRASTDQLIDVRDSDEFEKKAFWLDGDYNWEIKKDRKGLLCLIPTKKK